MLKKNVHFLLPSLKFGGAEKAVISLASEMKKNNYKVGFILMSNEGEFINESKKLGAIYDLKCNKTYKLPWKLFLHCIKNKPDVVISSFWKLNICSCFTRVFYPFFQLLLWEHSISSKSTNHSKLAYSLTSSVLYHLSTGVVAVSNGVSDDIKNNTLSINYLINVIFNPVHPPDKKYIMRSNKKHTIVYVGRLEPVKNVSLILKSIALIPESYKVKLYIVGDGSLRNSLEDECKTLNIRKKVEFVGYIDNPYLYISRSNLLVLSSNHEALGNVIIEALYCGLPVVATDASRGIYDILHDGKFGTIVPKNDKIAMSKAIMGEFNTSRSVVDQQKRAHDYLPSVALKKFENIFNHSALVFNRNNT